MEHSGLSPLDWALASWTCFKSADFSEDTRADFREDKKFGNIDGRFCELTHIVLRYTTQVLC